jgi:hypothetical protein
MRPLTDRDIETLRELAVATNPRDAFAREGWVMPMDGNYIHESISFVSRVAGKRLTYKALIA